MKRTLRFHSPAEIREHLSRQQSSNLSVENYCTQAKVSPSTFWNWRKKYGGITLPSSPVPFVRVPLPLATLPSIPYEIVFENRITLKVPVRYDRESLQSLISILR
jgi:hypothetical protein